MFLNPVCHPRENGDPVSFICYNYPMKTEFIFLPLHIGILLFIIWNIYKADHMGFYWILGKIEKLNASIVKKYHRNIFFGLIGMVITGIGLYIPLREKLSGSTAFKIKMAFVIVLFINSFVIYRFMPIASEKKHSELSMKEKLPLMMSSVISTLSWVGALIAVMFLPD